MVRGSVFALTSRLCAEGEARIGQTRGRFNAKKLAGEDLSKIFDATGERNPFDSGVELSYASFYHATAVALTWRVPPDGPGARRRRRLAKSSLPWNRGIA